ncbi:hypothetical protein GCM10007424_21230 [Flavobacterium suaedae]|uniref:Anti-sigma factor n=1 Tax=Flavobacterium suaedae TaxID=1767027 RepID=A0ABQ1K0Z9_9FLAO|nr:hypothetical protein [Flavobacterium suaedae]GGB80895.1 hypothetical protein GCM10007424_21230 [Flavobacterium suaedae]
MSKEKDKIETFFSNLKDSSWDTEEPTIGHRERFMAKLGKQEGTGNQSKPKSFRRLWLTVATPIAAAIVLFLGIFLTYSPEDTIENDIATNEIADLPPKVQETQLYFSGIIKQEMAKIEKESTPETKKIVDDAVLRMAELEKDYDKLIIEIQKNGENKRIIRAMITNLQTRISFLEEVLIRIENTKKLKQNYHEKNKT